jgi:hypothetical protein
MFDVHLMLGFGVVGYLMMKLRFRSRPVSATWLSVTLWRADSADCGRRRQRVRLATEGDRLPGYP